MAGTLSDSAREAAWIALRRAAERVIDSGRTKHRRALEEAWCRFPELRYEPVPAAKDVLVMLDQADLERAVAASEIVRTFRAAQEA